MRKGVLLVGNHPPPYGGVPTHIRYLAPYLVGRGWDVHVLALAGWRSLGRGTKEKLDGYFVHRPTKLDLLAKLFRSGWGLRSPFRSTRYAFEDPRGFVAFSAMANEIKGIVQRFDLRLVSAYHILAGLAAGWACEDLSLPLVTTIFGEIYDDPDYYRRRRNEVQFVCDKSHAILAPSEHCAASLGLMGITRRVQAIYYGIDTSVFKPENDGGILKKELGIGPNERVVVFVGRMEKEMGLHILLDAIPMALETMKNLKFIIAGRRGDLYENAADLSSNIPSAVFVVADVPQQELPFEYAASTLAVVPSINDRACLGLAIAEAMATGKPVIVSDAGGGREVLADGETGVLIEPSNSAALAQAVVQLAEDDEAIANMGRNGRKRAVELFDKEITNRRVEEVLSQAYNA